MKNKILTGIAITILGALLVICTYFGVRTLLRKKNPEEISVSRLTKLEKGKWVTFRAYYAFESAHTIKHTINGVIPTGTEYYYMIFTEDFGRIMIIRADKNWYDRNFDSEGVAKDEDGCLVTGYVRATPGEVDRSITLYRNKLQESYKITIALQSSLYTDTIAVKVSILQILVGVIPIILGIGFLVSIKAGILSATLDSRAGKIFVVLLLVFIFAYGGMTIHFLSLI